MTHYQLTPQALDDLFAIWSYIAKDSPAAADRVEEAIYLACERLAESPMIGTIRKDLTALPVRFWLVTRCSASPPTRHFPPSCEVLAISSGSPAAQSGHSSGVHKL